MNDKFNLHILLCISILTSIMVSGCVSKSKYEKAQEEINSLKEENKKLKVINEELLNGEDRLMNYIKLYSDSNDYIKAYESLIKLKKYHPESNKLGQNNKLFTQIEKIALAKIDSIKEAKEDSLKRANINELGDWGIGNFINDFDEPTGEKYVHANFWGQFSNSATANDKLRINIRIYGDKKNPIVDIRFDEYDNGTYEDEKIEYTKIINKKSRKKYIGERSFYSFTDIESKEGNRLIDILTKEGVYEFYMRLDYKTVYEFSINTNYLNNALIKAGLKELE